MAAPVQGLAAYLQRLCVAESAFVQREADVPDCTSSLKTANNAIVAAHGQMQRAVQALADLLAMAADSPKSQDAATLLTALNQLEAVQSAFQSICAAYTYVER